MEFFMNTKNVKAGALLLLSFISASAVYASTATIGTLAYNVTGSFAQIGSLMMGVAYVAGLGFGISAIFKFKQHKDNPTQIPIGTPFALLAVSVILMFLPSIYAPAGATVFGSSSTGGGFTGAGASSLPDA
jgi:intracellular multiplication protein IcmD